jgi:hypothetical protein
MNVTEQAQPTQPTLSPSIKDAIEGLKPKTHTPAEAKAPDILAAKEAEKGEEGAPKTLDGKGEPQKEPEKKESVAEKFTLAAKRERALVQKEEAFKQTQATFEAKVQEREAQLVAREEKIKELETLFEQGKSDPLSALKKLGWTYQELTNRVLNNDKPTAEQELKQVRDELGTFKKQLTEEKQKEIEERKQKEEEDLKNLEKERSQAMEKFRTDLHSYIKEKGEAYELINTYEEHDLVLALIENHYERTGESMEVDKASELAEKYLEEKYFGKLSKTKKYSSKIVTEEKKDEPKPSQASSAKTLTNTMGTSTATHASVAHSEEERIRRALAVAEKFKSRA